MTEADYQQFMDRLYAASPNVKPIKNVELRDDGLYYATDEDGRVQMIYGQSFSDALQNHFK